MTDCEKSGFSLRSLLSRFLARRRELRTARELLSLSDAMLRDIGVSRWDVQAAVSVPCGLSLSQSLAKAVAESSRRAANDRFSRVSGEVRNVGMAA